MNMAMLQQIAQTKSHHQVHLQDKETHILTQDAVIDLPPTMTIEAGTVPMTIMIDIDLTGQDPIPIVIDTGVTVRVLPKGATPDHTIDIYITAHYTTETQGHTAIDEILHIEDLHHTEVFKRSQ